VALIISSTKFLLVERLEPLEHDTTVLLSALMARNFVLSFRLLFVQHALELVAQLDGERVGIFLGQRTRQIRTLLAMLARKRE